MTCWLALIMVKRCCQPAGTFPEHSVFLTHTRLMKSPQKVLGLVPRSQVAAARGVPLLRGPTGIFFVKMTTISSYAASAPMSSEERRLWAFKGSDQLLGLYEKAQNWNTSCWRLGKMDVLVCWKKSSFQCFFWRSWKGAGLSWLLNQLYKFFGPHTTTTVCSVDKKKPWRLTQITEAQCLKKVIGRQPQSDKTTAFSSHIFK